MVMMIMILPNPFDPDIFIFLCRLRALVHVVQCIHNLGVHYSSYKLKRVFDTVYILKRLRIMGSSETFLSFSQLERLFTFLIRHESSATFFSLVSNPKKV